MFTFVTFTEEISSTRDHNVRGALDYSTKDLTFLFVKLVIGIYINSWIFFLELFLASHSE